MAPTAARSRVGTSWTASAGSPASASPSAMASAMARAVRKLSDPARRMAALPALRQSAAASAVTFGRLSKITPTTPSGVATRSITRPFGRSNVASTRPTGSGRAGDARDRVRDRRPAAPGSSVSRSMKAAACPFALRVGHVVRVGGQDVREHARMRAAIARSAAFFSASVAMPASRRAAIRARRPISAIMSETVRPPATESGSAALSREALAAGLRVRAASMSAYQSSSEERSLARPASSREPSNLPEVRIGTSGWHYEAWRGPFYPQDMKTKDFLSFYITRFSTTELNNPFYRLPTEAAVQAWRKSTPETFLFAWKASRLITHLKRLKEVEENVPFMFRRTKGLGQKLGPVLFQLPPSLKADPRAAGALSGPAAQKIGATPSSSATRAGTSRRSSTFWASTTPRSASPTTPPRPRPGR